MALVGFRAPALPLPPNDYNRQQFDELVRALRIYFNLIDSLTPQQAQSYRADSFFGGNFTGDSVSATSVSGGAINGGVISGFNRGIEAPYAMLMSRRRSIQCWYYLRELNFLQHTHISVWHSG
jgi:hypothetical protein